MKIFIITVLIIAVLVPAAAWFMAGFVMTGRRQTPDEAFKWQSEHYDTSFYGEITKTDYIVDGYDGYVLHVQALMNPARTGKYVIITHGYTDNHMGALKYARFYLELGYNCIIYDLRGHGENEPACTTYGILEAKDLERLIADTRSRYQDMTQLGLHGESLGAATTVTVLKYEPEVDFAVADCGFEDIENVLRGADNSRMPAILFNIANLGAKLRTGFTLRSMRPIDSLDNNTIPAMFIHGADDTLISTKNSQDMYDRTGGMKEIHIIAGAEHAASAITAPEDYKEYLSDFLNRMG